MYPSENLLRTLPSLSFTAALITWIYGGTVKQETPRCIERGVDHKEDRGGAKLGIDDMEVDSCNEKVKS